MADEKGVLGNLPRSRPGRRSAKRTGNTADAPSTRRAAPKTAKPRTAPPKPAADARPHASASRSPVSGVLRTVTSLAGGGARLAHGAARGVLRRLPRP
jgi:hypothetical protein